MKLENEKEEIAIDYELELEKECIIKITLHNGEEIQKIINTKNLRVEKKYLIENGKDNTEVTGGWEGIPYYGRETGTLTFGEEYADYIGTDNYTVYRKATVNSIDWSSYNTINMKAKAYNELGGFSSYGGIGVEIINSKSNYTSFEGRQIVVAYLKKPPINEEQILSAVIPYNQYVNNTYISIEIHRCYMYIYDVWLEKYILE